MSESQTPDEDLTIEGKTPDGKEFRIEYYPDEDEVKITGRHENQGGGVTETTEYMDVDDIEQAIELHEGELERHRDNLEEIEETLDDLEDRGGDEKYSHFEQKVVDAIKKYQAKNAYENKVDERDNVEEKLEEQREWADNLKEMRDRIESDS
jgi:hypothetical protein